MTTIDHMLDRFGIQFEGKKHSGKDDAYNLAICVIELIKRGFEFTENMVYRRLY